MSRSDADRKRASGGGRQQRRPAQSRLERETGPAVDRVREAIAIVRDAATPRGTGVLMRASPTALVDIEVTGAADAAVVVDGTSFAAVLPSDVHDHPGAALTIRSASARLARNVCMRNRTSERVRRSFIIDDGASLLFTGNVFPDVSRDRVDDSRDGARAVAARDHRFVDEARSTVPAPPRIQRGR